MSVCPTCGSPLDAATFLLSLPESQRARVAAEWIYGMGLHVDALEVKAVVAGAGIDLQHLRRVYEAVARGREAERYRTQEALKSVQRAIDNNRKQK